MLLPRFNRAGCDFHRSRSLLVEKTIPSSSLVFILAHADATHQWRSSSGQDDKCHPGRNITITTADRAGKLRPEFTPGGVRPASAAASQAARTTRYDFESCSGFRNR